MRAMKKTDEDLFNMAVDKLGAVEARTGLFKSGDMAFPTTNPEVGVIHCFNASGEEVCLWYSGVSTRYRLLEPKRKWPPHHKRKTTIIMRKGD